MDTQELTNTTDAVILYFSHDACNVCKVLLPKIKQLAVNKFPKIELKFIDTKEQQELIFELVEKVAGTAKVAKEKPHIFLNNIQRRMYTTGYSCPYEYVKYAKRNLKEHGYLVSSLTIHTTYWFREPRHFEYLQSQLESFKK